MERCPACGGDDDGRSDICTYCGIALRKRRRLDVAWTATASRGLVGLGRLELEAALSVSEDGARAIAQSAFVVVADRLGPDTPRSTLAQAMREQVEKLLPSDGKVLAVEIDSFELPRSTPADDRPLRAAPPAPLSVPLEGPSPPRREAPRREERPGLFARLGAWLRALLWRLVKATVLLAALAWGGHALWTKQLRPRLLGGSTEPAGGDADPDVDAAPAVDPREHLREGLALLEQGAYEAAALAFTRGLEADPGLVEAWGGRARARVAQGDTQGALEDCGRALERAPTAELHTLRAQVLVQLGRGDEALSELTRALELDPDHTPAYFRRGLVHKGRGEHQASLADFERALTRQPDDVVARYNQGLARHHLGDLAGAIADYEQVLARKPDHAPSRDNLALARAGSPPR